MATDRLTFSSLMLVAIERFKENHIDTPELDARILLEYAAGFSHASLISNANETVSSKLEDEFETLIARRLNFEPVHRIIGSREFYGRDFKLSKDTLIPRDDTEVLVEEVLSVYRQLNDKKRFLEIGTGSGILAVTLASELPNCSFQATDISEDALNTASQNASTHKVGDRIYFANHDLYDGIEGQFDAIISNPPYIPTNDIHNLSAEVREHDPIAALDGGQSGFDFYEAIFANAPQYLIPHGRIFVEIGIHQSERVSQVAQDAGFVDIIIRKDYAGIPRVISAKLANNG